MSEPAFTSRYWNVRGTLVHAWVSVNKPSQAQPVIVLAHGLIIT